MRFDNRMGFKKPLDQTESLATDGLKIGVVFKRRIAIVSM